jgi:hypothetical protein
MRYVTDSNGIVALDEPGLVGRTVFFHVKSHGYAVPKDGFGYRGAKIRITEGGNTQVKIKRINIAERLYRVTGEGIYRDSLLVGEPVPIKRPLLNAQVFGSDSVLSAVFRGKIYWFWGDTNRPGYPLGNFHTPGATSLLPDEGGLDPNLGIDLDYFLDSKGFAKETARMPGSGPTWLSGLVTLSGKEKGERLFAAYVKIRDGLTEYERGIVEFNPTTQKFEKVVEFDLQAPIRPSGHPFRHKVGGVEYVYFADPVPLVRVRAEPDRFASVADYEAFSCLKEGTRLDDFKLDRAEDGTLRYAWKKNTPPLGPRNQARWIRAGHLKAEEARPYLKDGAAGKPVVAHRGSVYWNDYRRRWVMIFVEVGGSSSHLGEVWYAEADAPEGPWVNLKKILTHERYSFYNPKQHSMFDQHDGRVIYFEGTYSHTFSGNSDQTPRYDYNQIMYKLDLSDSRLALPTRKR